jgi:hypothetical protein
MPPEIIKVSSETLVNPFLKQITKTVGPHNVLIITSEESSDSIDEYISYLTDVSVLSKYIKGVNIHLT